MLTDIRKVVVQKKTLQDSRHREIEQRMTRIEEGQTRILALLDGTSHLSQTPSHPPVTTTSVPSAPLLQGNIQMDSRTVSTSANGTSGSDAQAICGDDKAAPPASDPSTLH